MALTYKAANVDNISASQQMLAITNGAVLNISSWGGTIHNLSTISGGHVRLRDGGATGAIRASWTLPTAVAGTVAPLVRIGSDMPVWKRFTGSDVYIEIVSGTIMMSFQFTGLEES